MTPSPEPAGRRFVQRCDGAEPGELPDEDRAAAAPDRVTGKGFELVGSLLTHATGLGDPDLLPIRLLLTDPALPEQTLSP